MGGRQSRPKISQPKPLQPVLSQQVSEVNKIIQVANQAITCGPECQAQKNIDDLQQRYLSAQANVATAPQQLEKAEKDYFTASKGYAYYSEFLKNQLQGKADIMGNTLKTNFDKNIQLTANFSQTYDSLSMNYKHILELFNGYVKSNESLKGEINSVQKDIVTNDRKTYYEYEHFNSMKNWYYLFKWIYILLVFVFILGIFFVRNTYSFSYKIFLVVLFLLYPFVIDFLVIYFIQLCHQIYSLLPTNIYTKL